MNQWKASVLLIVALLMPSCLGAPKAQGASLYEATLAEADQKTPEISTEQMRQVLAEREAVILDTRPRKEFVGGHIPLAQNLDVPSSDVVAAVERLVNGDKSKALVLYCNGPFCQASRRVGDQLAAAGFSNVRRYQLGMPIWRALGGPTEIDLEGVVRVFKNDKTAVFFDARSAAEFAKGSVIGAHNVPVDQIATGGLQKAPMPHEDFNTRIVLFGRDAVQARMLADALSKRPWHNVAYFSGPVERLMEALK